MTQEKTAPPGTIADIDWSGDTTIRSTIFDDIYFSDADGLAETRHVFLAGNDLPARLEKLQQGQSFNVAELGFGTGLNLLALWQHRQECEAANGHLNFLSFEAFPLSQEDFAKVQHRIARLWPELAEVSRILTAHYPVPLTGTHVLYLAPNLTVTLVIGAVADALPQTTGRIDAWFLDGFSPAKNPAMWTQHVCAEIGRLSKTGATAATFTVAGFVRRNLQAAGFEIAKRPGFGRKRDMLTAHKAPAHKEPPAAPPAETEDDSAQTPPWFSLQQLPKITRRKKILIAGAGIAGASLAWHLSRAGHEVSLLDREGVAAGATGNPAGLIMPRLDLDETPEAKFYRACWLHAVRFIEMLEERTGIQIFLSRGGIMLAQSAHASVRHARQVKERDFPEHMMQLISTKEAETLVGQPLELPQDWQHLYFPKAGTVSPRDYVDALLLGSEVCLGALQSFEAGAEIISQITTPAGDVTQRSDGLILATAYAAAPYLPRNALEATHGQLDIVAHTPPKMAISFGHYAAPFGQQTVTGATYTPQQADESAQWRASHRDQNVSATAKLIPAFQDTATTPSGTEPGRAAQRCMTPDHLPVVGPLPDDAFYDATYGGLRTGRKINRTEKAHYRRGVFLLTGLGSRGLVTAPLCAHFLSSQITQGPSPLPAPQANLLHPARFMIRNLKRNLP